MIIDSNKREIDFKNTLMLKNSNIGIELKGISNDFKVGFSNANIICRNNKSKIITKLKWIWAIIKFKI